VLNNVVNRHDVDHVVQFARRGELGVVARRLIAPQSQRVRETWSDPAPPPTNWWDLPYFEDRWNLLASGDPAVDHVTYIASRHLGHDLSAISLGCGTGERELRWAATGRFARLVGVDLSAQRIEAARQVAANTPNATGVVEFEVADVQTIGVPPQSLDVVIGESSLHHLAGVHSALVRARSWLKPGGLVLVNEFVGPTRFQWTNRQLEAANALLNLLPQRLRRQADGRLKKRVVRPSHLAMRYDPSEAIESGNIVPALDELFERIEFRRMGGTLSHLVFSKIAQNFAADDAEARRFAAFVFDSEDALMDTGDIGSDYIVGVWRRREEAQPTAGD
jgi:ubiquinone/menaquinone biosynthesis C-methylase UbiE